MNIKLVQGTKHNIIQSYHQHLILIVVLAVGTTTVNEIRPKEWMASIIQSLFQAFTTIQMEVSIHGPLYREGLKPMARLVILLYIVKGKGAIQSTATISHQPFLGGPSLYSSKISQQLNNSIAHVTGSCRAGFSFGGDK